MTPAEIREIAREVAREVIQEMDAHGVQLTDEEKLYVRRSAKGAEQVATWTRRSLVTAAVSGIVWMLYEGLMRALGR